jgi:hypothetical protein
MPNTPGYRINHLPFAGIAQDPNTIDANPKEIGMVRRVVNSDGRARLEICAHAHGALTAYAPYQLTTDDDAAKTPKTAPINSTGSDTQTDFQIVVPQASVAAAGCVWLAFQGTVVGNADGGGIADHNTVRVIRSTSAFNDSGSAHTALGARAADIVGYAVNGSDIPAGAAGTIYLFGHNCLIRAT